MSFDAVSYIMGLKSDGSAEDSEAYAIGKRDGVDVDSDDPAYHNNSKYFADMAKDYSEHIADPVNGIVTNWLQENISQETGYALDRSLASDQAAAPADLAGELKSAINDNTSDISVLQASVTNLGTHKVAQPLDSNNQPTNGTSGQSLRTKGDGTTEWADVGLPTDAQTAQAVSDWLDEHPEATTTVQDGSLTEPKFSEALKLKTIKDYVTPEMFGAKGDGVTDDTNAINQCLQSGKPIVVPDGTYKITSTLTISAEQLSVVSYSRNTNYNKCVFLFVDCDGIIIKGGSRYIRWDGVTLKSSVTSNNTYVAINHQSSSTGSNTSDIHKVIFTNLFIINFNIGISDGDCTLWNCEYSHIRTQDVNTGVHFGQTITNSNFGIRFQDVFFDNAQVFIQHSKISFQQCNFGIRRQYQISCSSSTILDFDNCNFEMDVTTISNPCIKLNGKDYIFTNCQFVIAGNSSVMMTFDFDTRLVRLVACSCSKKNSAQGTMFDSLISGGDYGFLEIVKCIDIPVPNRGSTYSAVVKPDPSSILVGSDDTTYKYPIQSLRYSSVRNRLEYTHDGHNFIDINGNSTSVWQGIPFVFANGLIMDIGRKTVTGDIETLNFNTTIQNYLGVFLTPGIIYASDGTPVMVMQSQESDYYPPASYTVIRLKMWNGSSWVNNTKSVVVRWLLIGRKVV